MDSIMRAITVFLLSGVLLLPSLLKAGEADQLQTRAKLGDVKAQVQLGEKYFRGERVPQNYTEAYRWFAKAADRGNPEGQHRLGQMYARGIGVLQDDAEAVRWYFLSAEKGYPEAQYDLGEMHMNGRGVLRVITSYSIHYTKLYESRPAPWTASSTRLLKDRATSATSPVARPRRRSATTTARCTSGTS